MLHDAVAAAIIARARACIGAPFRAQGREPATGLDCVGLVRAAIAPGASVPDDYRLGGAHGDRIAATLTALGLRVSNRMTAGSVVAMRPSDRQWHLGIWSGAGLIHADIGIGRVVERPGSPPWPVAMTWVMTEKKDR